MGLVDENNPDRSGMWIVYEAFGDSEETDWLKTVWVVTKAGS